MQHTGFKHKEVKNVGKRNHSSDVRVVVNNNRSMHL